VLKQVAGGGTGQRMLKGNVCVYPQDLQGIIDHVLPLPVANAADGIRVVFVGSTRPTKSQLSRFYNVRKAKVQAALRWFLEHRKTGAYTKCRFDQTCLDDLPDNDVPDGVLELVSQANESDFNNAHAGYAADIEQVLRQSAQEEDTMNETHSPAEQSIAGDNEDDIVVCETYGVVDTNALNSVFDEHLERAAWLNMSASLQAGRQGGESTDHDAREEPLLKLPHGHSFVSHIQSTDFFVETLAYLFP
jgi:hypothetical protein